MPNVHVDAERLINVYGRSAAGECLYRALDCAAAAAGDDECEVRWLKVAALVIEIQDQSRVTAIR
jgi:hypothetical protein